MNTRQLAPGLRQWTAPHPNWTPERGGPGGWERMVGCLSYAAPDALVLIDPLAPRQGTQEAKGFWAALDEQVHSAGLPLAVLVANEYHGRDADSIHGRYRERTAVSVHAPSEAGERLSCTPTHRFGHGAVLPGGVTAHAVEGLDAGETALFLPGPQALVFADAVIGAGSGAVQVAPESWAAEGSAARALYAEAFRPSIRRLVALEPAMLVPSHGEPVLEAGAAALAKAVEAAAWGEESCSVLPRSPLP